MPTACTSWVRESMATTLGSVLFKDHYPDRDCVVVEKLKAAGAIILAKTNVPPRLRDLQASNPVFGRTNNPWDLDRTRGGVQILQPSLGAVGSDWYQGTELNATAIEARVKRLRDHPALLCWTLWDEPDSNVDNVPRVQAVYDLVNRVDPYHPATPVFMSGGAKAIGAEEKKMQDAFNSQINWEFYSGYLYLSMASQFSERGSL